MSTHIVFEYLVNSLWQLPLLALATWLVIRIARPGLLAQHALWCAALALGVLLPLRGIEEDQPRPVQVLFVSADAQAMPDGFPATSVSHPKATLAAFRVRPIHLQSRTVDWLIDLYAVSVAFSLARLVHGWIGVRRLANSAARHPLTALESTLLRACAERLRLAPARLPEVRFLDDAHASPMIVGIRRPILLLPESMRHSDASGFDDTALAALLLHELSHVRRRDFLANVAARIVALPIAYHPATTAVQRRIRQTREMICDADAAEVFPSKARYARSLLALAESIAIPPQHVEAVGLFDHTRTSLEERIMKLTEPKLPLNLTLRTLRIAAAAVVLVAGTGTAATMHLKTTPPVVYAMQAAPVPAAVPEALPQAATQEVTPAPAPRVARKTATDNTDDTQVVRKLSAEERKQIAEQVAAATAQARDLKLDLKPMPKIVVTMPDMKFLEWPEFKKQMADMKIQFDSPEFKTQMDEMKRRFESGEFRKQLDEAAVQAQKAMADSGEFKKRMDEVNQRMNSPEFKQQMEDAKKMAFTARVDAEKHMMEARKQLDDASAAIAEARKQVHDAGVERQLDEAQRRIEQAKKNY